MIHPALLLLIGLLCEALIQFGKRSIYWFDTSASWAHIIILFLGDLVFFGLFMSMLLHLTLQRKHWITVGLFFLLFVYTAYTSGLAAAALATRDTYLWLFATALFIFSVEKPIDPKVAQSFVGASLLIALLLIAYAIVQIENNFSFEKEWFEHSGTSLSYAGVTNFGRAAKAFSLMSGPTDFASFGLFVIAVGVASRSLILSSLGLLITVMSGTRGIFMSIPIWLLLSWTSANNLRRNFFLLIMLFFGAVYFFSDELMTLFYSLPNSRFSLATLAPRIELWMNLQPENLLIGNGFAANLSHGNLAATPRVIDSGFIYLISEIGAPLTFAFAYYLLTAAKQDLMGSRRGILQLYVGVLLVCSTVQIPFQTRLSNFLVCLIIYADIYNAKIIYLHSPRRQETI